jgi:hypothetical protein
LAVRPVKWIPPKCLIGVIELKNNLISQRKTDVRAFQGLKQEAVKFVQFLQEFSVEDLTIKFREPIPPIDEIQLYYFSTRKLLSSIYHPVLKAIVAGHGFPENDVKIGISFHGSLFKGRTCFVPQHGSYDNIFAADLLELLNENSELRTVISGIDLEKGLITYSSQMDSWAIQLVPIPGSFVSMLIPPAKYLIKLKEEEVETLVTSTKLIAQTLARIGNGEKAVVNRALNGW